jgi:predicted transcriptional regulator YheO
MFAELAINLLASAVLVAGGYLWGIYRERQSQNGQNLEEYDFYPFGIDETKSVFFDDVKFLRAVDYLLKHRNNIAARQLILVGNQSDVENKLSAVAKRRYKKLYNRYDGAKIKNDRDKFLRNFDRIVRLIGESFPDTGIEIILHDLTNPMHALSCIRNNVTGREIGAPATNLVLDLKTRRELKQDKLNYELNIGARKFKCTTIPVFRDPDGLVAAVCINVDVNYLTDEVLSSTENMEAFIKSICKTDMQLGENILSKNEYQKALDGKRHFRDF